MTHQQPREERLLRQLIGEWQVGIAMKTIEGKIVAGCGEMTAVEKDSIINSEVNTRIEGYEDYYENDMWSYDTEKGEVHLLSITSDGQIQDHIGKWVDDNTLELGWRGTFEDQDKEECINVRWISKDQFELILTNYSLGKLLLTTDYVFKRKEV